MPIKIHHGPPGSYKTSGALGDDFLREAKTGRVIVTNVRGLTRDRVIEEFPELPETFDVIHIDDKSPEGRERLAKWFHWVPPGAFLFIDEAQMIWPKYWRDADIQGLAYPGGLEKATEDNRPATWHEAWEKHRHWNWDFVLTTPNIAKLRTDIRETADAAYKHKDLALIGWTGRYMEGFHAPDDNGSNPSQFYSLIKKKVPEYVFKLYDSTTTGQHSHTKSGLSILKNPKLLVPLSVVVFAVGYALTHPINLGAPESIGQNANKPAQASVAGSQIHIDQTDTHNVNSVAYSKGNNAPAVTGSMEYLAQYQPRVEGLPHTAPAYDQITQPVEPPEPVGCITSKTTGCKCYTQQGTAYETTEAICEQIMTKGMFMPWKKTAPAQEQTQIASYNNQYRQQEPPQEAGNQVMEVNSLPPMTLSETPKKSSFP